MDLLTITLEKYLRRDSWIILQYNFKRLLLNEKQMLHEILFSLLHEIQNRNNRKKGNLKKK